MIHHGAKLLLQVDVRVCEKSPLDLPFLSQGFDGQLPVRAQG